MKRWLVIIIIALVLLVVIGAMSGSSFLQGFEWQSLTMLFAALAGPIKFVIKSFQSDADTKSLLEGKEVYETEKQEQIAERERIDKEIADKQQRIQVLDKEVELLDAKLVNLEQKRQNLAVDPQNRTVDDANSRLESLLK